MAKPRITTDRFTTPRRYEQRRDSIIRAAAVVFAEKGFHGASTQDIADRLGINQAALYYYFPSKEAALEAVCHYGISHAAERIGQVVVQSRPLRETLRQIFFTQISGWQIHCDYLTVYQQQRHLLTGERRERVREEGRNYERLIFGLLQSARRQGDISPDIDVRLATRALISLGGSVVGLYRRGEAHDVDHIADQFSRLFYSGIQPDRAKRQAAPAPARRLVPKSHLADGPQQTRRRNLRRHSPAP